MFVRGVIFRRPQHGAVNHSDRSVMIFAVLWMVLEAAGVAAQRRMYAYHFLVLLCPRRCYLG